MRKTTKSESQLMERLLSIDFPGCTELRQQFKRASVEEIDENGSLRFHIFG